jgi:hypothetical protein
MRDILGEVVRELEASKALKGGWSRGCPVDRSERALIEVWVGATTKFTDKYVIDVGRLEGKVTDLSTQLSVANTKLAACERELREIAAEKVRVGITAHVDRLGSKIGSDEATRLLADVAA